MFRHTLSVCQRWSMLSSGRIWVLSNFVPDLEDRIAELELRLMAQDDLIEQLHEEVLDANGTLARLVKRLERIEEQLQAVVRTIDVPANERPPHY